MWLIILVILWFLNISWLQRLDLAWKPSLVHFLFNGCSRGPWLLDVSVKLGNLAQVKFLLILLLFIREGVFDVHLAVGVAEIAVVLASIDHLFD
jgi:hypothetical protein